MADLVSNPWLRSRRRLASARLRLVCCTYAGGGASIFHRWPDKLPSDIDVCAVQLPGRQDRLDERPLTRLTTMVDGIVGALAALPPLPLALFGHSLGAFVAFEVARRLQREGTPAVALIAGAARAPCVANRATAIHAASDAAFLEAIHQRYGTPWHVLRNADLMSLTLPSFRGDLEAFETYRYQPGPPLVTPITALRGLKDERVTEEDVAAWQGLTSGALSVAAIDAGHLFVDSHADWVIEKVKAALPPARLDVSS